MPTFAPSSALPSTFDQRIRWWSFENKTSLEIPPYAIMQLAPVIVKGQPSRHLCQFNHNGEVIWNVQQCDDDAASRQNPAEFMFNGPVACRPHGRARGTFDLPAQVLHNGISDTLPNGYPCGPVADAWYVLQGRPAFVCRSHDATEASGGSGIHTVWIDRGNGDLGIHVAGLAGAGSYSADSFIGWESENNWQFNNAATLSDDGWLTVRYSGYYDFRFSCTIYGQADVVRGSPLRVRLYQRAEFDSPSSPPTPEATSWSGYRTHDIEQYLSGDDLPVSQDGLVDGEPGETSIQIGGSYDVSLHTTQENIAFGGPVNLQRGESIRLKNVGSAATIAEAQFSLVRLFQRYDPNPPSAGGLL